MEFIKKKTVQLPIVLMSLLVGIYVDVKCINWTLAYGFFSGGEGGFMSLLYPAIVVCIFAIYLFTNIKYEAAPSLTSFLISVFLIIFYIFTTTFVGPPRVSVAFFSLFVVVGLILPCFTIVDGKYLIVSVMLWPCVAIFRLDQVFQMALSWKDVISMDASYAFMTPVIASVVYLFCYYRNDNRWQKIFMTVLVLINAVFFLKLFQYGSRGPLFAILLTIVFFLSTKHSEYKEGIVINRKRIVVGLFFLFVLFFSMDFFVDGLFAFMGKIGIKSSVLEKIARLSAEGNLLNGRGNLQILALNGFWDNILFGNGLDRFDANTGLAYPHNFVLQILYDGGLLLFCVLLIPIVAKTILNYKRCSYNRYVVQTFLFFSSVPYASFSQDLWENAVFWLFVGSLFPSTFDCFVNQSRSFANGKMFPSLVRRNTSV